MKKAVLVLPTYNEQGTVESVIRGVFDAAKTNPNWEFHILVVDSTSHDGTAATVKKLQKSNKYLHLLETKKEGLGKAYVHGFTYASEKLNPYLILEMDADLSHEPERIPVFLNEIEKGADFVIGSRYIKGGSIPENWGIDRKFLSVFGNYVLRLGFMKPRITDWTSGFRAIKSWIVRDATSHIKNYTGYVFQVAFLDYALKNHARIVEIPINFGERSYGKSKLNSLQTILQTFIYMLNHSSFIKYVIVGSIGFLLDFGVAYFLIHGLDFFKPTANAISAEFAIISNFLFNNFWSFSHKRINGGLPEYFKKLIIFNLVSSGSIVMQWLGMTLSLKIFGDKLIDLAGIAFHSWIIYKVFIIVLLIIPYSYIIYNRVVWKSAKRHAL